MDDSFVELAESEVAAGRAASVSAWIADAIRAKARARSELIADLRELEQRDPTPTHVISSIARSLELPESAVIGAIGGRRGRSRARKA